MLRLILDRILSKIRLQDFRLVFFYMFLSSVMLSYEHLERQMDDLLWSFTEKQSFTIFGHSSPTGHVLAKKRLAGVVPVEFPLFRPSHRKSLCHCDRLICHIDQKRETKTLCSPTRPQAGAYGGCGRTLLHAVFVVSKSI